MNLRSDDDVKGIVEEVAEDRGRTMNRRSSRRRSALGSPRPGWGRAAFFGGVAVLILVAALVLLTGGEDPDETVPWQDLSARLDAVEARLDRMEASVKQIPALTGRIEGFAKSAGRMETGQRALRQRIEQLARRVKTQAGRPVPVQAGGQASAGGGARHTVQKGETLFSIARRYGLSVDQLCRLNDMDKAAVIHPGQALFVERAD
jgi:LysM repeat protein